MKDCSLKPASAPEKEKALEDPLTEVLRQGAKELIRKAVETELLEMLSAYSDVCLLDGRPAVVRNGNISQLSLRTKYDQLLYETALCFGAFWHNLSLVK